MTQKQLEVLARSNPLVAERMKAGYYNDRLAGGGGTSSGGGTRKSRARPAQLPEQAPSSRAPARKTSRAAPGTSRTKTRRAPGTSGTTPGETRRGSGFLKGLLGGG